MVTYMLSELVTATTPISCVAVQGGAVEVHQGKGGHASNLPQPRLPQNRHSQCQVNASGTLCLQTQFHMLADL